MNTLTTIVVLALLVLAGGCVAPSHLTAIPTCDWGQGTTCQDNLAEQMFDARGLRQVLNTTDYIDGLGMDSHLVVWRSGQDKFTLHALDIDAGANWTMADLPNSSFPCVHDGKMLIVHRAMANGANDSEATPWLWLPNQGVQRQVSMLAGRFGTPPSCFDGTWGLLGLVPASNSERPGLLAVNTLNGTTRIIEDAGPYDGLHNGHYRPTFWGFAIGGGSVFVNSLSYPNDVPQAHLMEHVLKTGEVRELLRLNATEIDALSAGPGYLAVSVSDHGQSGRIQVLNRANGTWSTFPRDPSATASFGVVGGNWCLYHEGLPSAPGFHDAHVWQGGIVGVYLPTGQRVELLPPTHGFNPTYVATDGNRFAVQMGGYFPGHGPDTYQQIYWGTLPQLSQAAPQVAVRNGS